MPTPVHDTPTSSTYRTDSVVTSVVRLPCRTHMYKLPPSSSTLQAPHSPTSPDPSSPLYTSKMLLSHVIHIRDVCMSQTVGYRMAPARSTSIMLNRVLEFLASICFARNSAASTVPSA